MAIALADLQLEKIALNEVADADYIMEVGVKAFAQAKWFMIKEGEPEREWSE